MKTVFPATAASHVSFVSSIAAAAQSNDDSATALMLNTKVAWGKVSAGFFSPHRTKLLVEPKTS